MSWNVQRISVMVSSHDERGPSEDDLLAELTAALEETMTQACAKYGSNVYWVVA